MKSDQSKIPAQNLDIRVRERLLHSGVLDASALQTHLAELPDLDAQADTISIDQPALGSRESE